MYSRDVDFLEVIRRLHHHDHEVREMPPKHLEQLRSPQFVLLQCRKGFQLVQQVLKREIDSAIIKSTGFYWERLK